MMKRQRLFGGRNTNRPKKRGSVFAGAALLVAGLALGFGCKRGDRARKPERVEKINRDPTAPPMMQSRPRMKRIPRTTKKRLVRRGDTLFHIEREDGSARPFMKVHRIGSKVLTLRAYNPAYMTPQEYELFIASGMIKVTYVGRMFPIPSIEVPFGETRRFEFGDWSLRIRADKGRRYGTAKITATVAGVRIR